MCEKFEKIDYWFGYWSACLNWEKWKDQYACKRTLPMLAGKDQERKTFKSFVSDYGLLRGVNNDGRAKVYEYLEEEFEGFYSNVNLTGNATVEDFADAMKEQTGINNRQVSMVTKLLCFQNPKQFFPMDKFNKGGLKKIDGGKLEDSYHNFNVRCHAAFGNHEGEINAVLNNVMIPVGADKCVLMYRIFDVMLMEMGGRWAPRKTVKS